jgi:hypothetical protein
MKNNNPIFAMLPPEVLLKAKKLAGEYYKEDRLKDLAGRHLVSLSAATIFLLFFNAANAWVFGAIATDFLNDASRS